MVLIKDLGMRYPTTTSKKKSRYGLFLCDMCKKEVTVITKKGKEVDMCGACGQKNKATRARSIIPVGTKLNDRAILSFISEVYTSPGSRRIGIFMCDCGKTTQTWISDVKAGHTKSCGCLKGEKHNESNTDLYKRWQGIKQRCYYKKHHQYKDYGGRGIRMCDEWKNSFSAFKEWVDSSNYKPYLTIERKDNDGNYEPKNCTWITRKEQSTNKKLEPNMTGFNYISKKINTYAYRLSIDGKIKEFQNNYKTAEEANDARLEHIKKRNAFKYQ